MKPTPSDGSWVPIPRWVCFVVMVLVPLALIVGDVLSCFTLTWQLLAAAVLLLLPFILPMVFYFVEETPWFKLRGSVVAGVADDDPVKPGAPPATAPLAEPAAPRPAEPPTPLIVSNIAPALTPEETAALPKRPTEFSRYMPNFDQLSPPELRIMRTFFMARSYAGADLLRWGFRVFPSNAHYLEYVAGAEPLLRHGLVELNAAGLLKLTDKGREFLRRNDVDMAVHGGPAWQDFAAADT